MLLWSTTRCQSIFLFIFNVKLDWQKGSYMSAGFCPHTATAYLKASCSHIIEWHSFKPQWLWCELIHTFERHWDDFVAYKVQQKRMQSFIASCMAVSSHGLAVSSSSCMALLKGFGWDTIAVAVQYTSVQMSRTKYNSSRVLLLRSKAFLYRLFSLQSHSDKSISLLFGLDSRDCSTSKTTINNNCTCALSLCLLSL